MNKESLPPKGSGPNLGNPQGFPSSGLLQVLYLIGALVCLLCSFLTPAAPHSSGQIFSENADISFLILGMLMAAIAYGIALSSTLEALGDQENSSE